VLIIPSSWGSQLGGHLHQHRTAISSAQKDASMHLHDFIEICDMQKFKNVENDVLKLNLFPFSLRGKAKEWLHSLPTASIKSWVDLKEAFIEKYYPLLKFCRIEIVFFLLGKMKMNM
jgi:hypothetical protein